MRRKALQSAGGWRADSLAEDTDTTARIKVADIVIADDGLGTNDLSLSGADADLFEIDGDTATSEVMWTVVNRARRENSRLGYFAAMYHKVTRAVREAVIAGRFEDGERMARLDRVFAERYLDAYDRWRSADEPTAAWQETRTQGNSWPNWSSRAGIAFLALGPKTANASVGVGSGPP